MLATSRTIQRTLLAILTVGLITVCFASGLLAGLAVLAMLAMLSLAVPRLLHWNTQRIGLQALQRKGAEEAGAGLSTELVRQAETIRTACTQCGACAAHCAFLQEHGLPGVIAGNGLDQPANQRTAFECSLCELCSAVCPEGLAPADMLLALRRQAVTEGSVDLTPFKPLLTYERLGGSKLFAYSDLPRSCRTVFFPGCTLPGTRPGATWRLFEHLQQGIPNLGIVLDCCSKPSHDLGRQERFEAAFGRVLGSLRERGVHRVVTACPNCFRMFKDYGDNLDVAMIYDLVRLPELSGKAEGSGTAMTVHDPCPLRSERQVQDSVRSILEGLGLSFEEMKHRRRLTVCCGEGGAAGFVRPEHARAWSSIRSSESGGRTVVTYCAGCAAFLGRRLPTLHLIDLLFDPDRALTGSLQASQGLRTYLNRLRLKRRFKKSLA